MKLSAGKITWGVACLAVILFLSPAGGEGLSPKRRLGPAASGVVYLAELERSIYRLTNEERRKQGLASLNWERSLSGVARAHSADMLIKGYFAHLSPEGKSPHERIAAGYPFGLALTGENIWSSTGYDAGEPRRLARMIVDRWMTSPGHRKNLLNPNFTDIGIGVATRGKDIRATQVFVRTKQ